MLVFRVLLVRRIRTRKCVLTTVAVFVGVDTHADTHHAAVIDTLGAHLSDQGFPVTSAGYGALCQWASSYGAVQAVGIDRTGS